MAEILLSSEAFVKSVSNISDNVAGKFILPSLREAQEVNLRSILGDCLLAKLKELVKDKTIDDGGNEPYKDLIDKCQYYLAYQTIVEVAQKVTYKIGNFGVSKSTDENLYVADADELSRQQYYYQSKADAYCLDLQGWLYERKASFPELRDCDCARIKSNLYSAATSGIWLGGPRGKKLTKSGCSCSSTTTPPTPPVNQEMNL